MSLARTALLRASRSQWLARQMSQRSFARRAVKRFMPGEDLSDALDAAQTLVGVKVGTIITRLGETLTGESNASAVRDHYLSALGMIASRSLPTQLSVKPTQLGLDTSVDECVRQIGAIAERSQAMGGSAHLWVDMEDSNYTEGTLAVYEQLKQRYDRVGLCLQAYLRRTRADLQRLLPLRPAIRLVKGAYAEPDTVAFPAKRDVDAEYMTLGETLLDAAARKAAFPVFGTHDMRIIRQLTARAEGLALNRDQYEIHMLYGIRASEQRSLAAAGHAVRCLISYGNNWFPWYMRRLAERPANVWFVVRSAFT